MIKKSCCSLKDDEAKSATMRYWIFNQDFLIHQSKSFKKPNHAILNRGCYRLTVDLRLSGQTCHVNNINLDPSM